MRVTIDGVAYMVTQKQFQAAFHMVAMTAEKHAVLPGAAKRLINSLTTARKPGKAPSYTAKQAATVLSMRADGHSMRAIAETVGLSLSCVQRICNKEIRE